ncbi:sigma-70 family RNA polymerase sigma factor [Ichthyenterobacterium sp. W332]|uniref:Sigma-70 family RNA polymerase sigma factor n=1 Tax=Microcosmobacter mediterraneus TaxID=3075607 RepID=A0ABU2YJ77_9FLAO|nr:sigma-70 family RNA polymerase sigma factor [Ichthyenterobacterium sp. W332]MDT0557290.1 sigma-70 family RNA polymerase sigma factor [Ichthyenterobacterium sp. W332]
MQDDSILISRLKTKDEKALALLYDKYAPAIFGVILRLCKDEGIAQEVLQDTFMTIWEKPDAYDPEKGRFYTWSYRIAKNKVLNILRKPKKLIQTEDLSVYKNKEAIELSNDSELALKGSINKLEAHHKRAIELVYFNGLTHREAHKEMDVPLGTFKSYLRQALKKLKESYSIALVLMLILIEVMR